MKKRQAGLQDLQAALDKCNKRIGPKLSGDLAEALKARLTDSNKLIIRQSLNTVLQVASYMGPPCAKYARYFVPGVFTGAFKLQQQQQKGLRKVSKSVFTKLHECVLYLGSTRTWRLKPLYVSQSNTQRSR